jgi:hypothetical protein
MRRFQQPKLVAVSYIDEIGNNERSLPASYLFMS